MNVSDVKRLGVTAVVLAVLILLWGLFVWLADAGHWNWSWPDAALGWTSATGWLWIVAGALGALMLVMGLLTFGLNTQPDGFTEGSERQLQCQDCKAVFMVHDTGHRPLTHTCPSCHALGVYDGKGPSVGIPPNPQPARNVVDLDLTCERCKHRFHTTDTGARPLQISCPNCHAVGKIN